MACELLTRNGIKKKDIDARDNKTTTNENNLLFKMIDFQKYFFLPCSVIRSRDISQGLFIIYKKIFFRSRKFLIL